MTSTLHGDGQTHERATPATVVLCTRDRPTLLVDALGALRAAAPDVEILVVDSASRTPETRAAALAAGVGYVRSDIPGLSIARNVGLAQATGEVVVFTDDDCLVDAGFLEPLTAPFADPRVGAATGHLLDASQSRPTPPASPVELTSVTAGLDAGHGALMAFRRSLLIDAGGFDPVLGAGRHFGGAEDMDALCRVLAAGSTVVRVPAAIVTHVYRRDDDDYERLNENYGRGIGAMCRKWLRSSPKDGAALTAVVLRRAASRYARRFRSRRTRRGQSAFIRGVFTGLREAKRMTVRDGVFVDAQPPAPISGVVQA